jgi:hypothetical protein
MFDLASSSITQPSQPVAALGHLDVYNSVWFNAMTPLLFCHDCNVVAFKSAKHDQYKILSKLTVLFILTERDDGRWISHDTGQF